MTFWQGRNGICRSEKIQQQKYKMPNYHILQVKLRKVVINVEMPGI